ncbi:MAG: helix-turn-helix domain-containing protein [Caulobacter sp.]|nr:helix-turn-helix domain-containing protein [Caulobacter sp.]
MNDLEVYPDFDYSGFGARLAETIAPEKPTAFAQRIGIPQNTVSKYIRGAGSAGPRLDLVAQIADGLGCSIDWLVWGRGDGPDASAGFVRIPRYDATLAAGAGSWNEGRRHLDDIPFTAEFLRKRLNRTSTLGLTVLTAAGDSMAPTIADGALLLVDEDDKHITDAVFAFVLDGDARVKRFRRTLSGITLVSDNQAYPPETVNGEDLARLQVIGKVLWGAQLL